jgi:Family of unknown function (DUF5906)
MNTIDKDLDTHRVDEIRFEMTKSQIHTMEQCDIENTLTQMELRYLPKNEINTLDTAFRTYYTQEDLGPFGPKTIQIDRVNEAFRHKKRSMNEIRFRAKHLGICSVETTDYDSNIYTINARIERLIQQFDDTYEQIFRHVRQWERCNTPMAIPPRLDSDGSIYRYSTDDDAEDKKSHWQELLLYLLDRLYRMRYRRYKEQCFREITTAEGKRTRAWQPVCDISEFVYMNSQKEDQYEMWKNLTSKGSCVKDTVNYLATTIDIQFPEIKKNRTVWSFQNGIYIGKFWDRENEKYITKFIEYGSNEFDTLDPTIVACKYFDQPFEDQSTKEDWYDIPTPHMQSVMEYQRFPEDVCRWLYVFCGRLCFEVNDMDSWQVIPYLKGLAGTGKSTLVTKVCAKFYDSEDVKTLSNNIEKKFGLDSICDGFMFISPEIKGDMALEQAEFQSLVSGEDMSIARKNQKAKSMTWKIPGILAGNEMPGWKDNSGSILRRILVWSFPRQVGETETDPQLEHKLESELPMIIQKCVRAYVEYSQLYRAKDIWSVVPDYFKQIRNQVAMVTSVLQNFLASEKVQFGKELCVPQRLFVQALQNHCIDNGFGRIKFTNDFYAGPFSSKEITVRVDSRSHHGKAYIAQPFIFGLDLVMDDAVPEFTNDR